MGKLEIELKKSTQMISAFLGDSVNPVSKILSIKWSETLKGGKVKIVDMIAEQTGMESSGQRFALMEEPLAISSIELIQTQNLIGA